MLEIRLTRAEKDTLIKKAVLDKLYRREANRKAHEERIAKGLRRFEKTVPCAFIPELRELVSAALAEVEAGRAPRLRRGHAAPPAVSITIDVVGDPGMKNAPQLPTTGLGPAGRRRAQAARRRARQRAAGLSRTTFVVPVAVAQGIGELIDQAVAWMSEGARVFLENGPASSEAVIAFTIGEQLPRPRVKALVFNDVGGQVDKNWEGETSPLFEDIQALDFLEKRSCLPKISS